ncbi:SDR family NAD(P)-dependent oxidoreductase [Dysgonomonas sp. HGC4]|uniref:SDR family NAD(P)-dependent oxidoreductase n=1 Tax=Dysgonomonas sp. HGC4 TaxID=1658009 RepID=UPI00067FAF9E|nr:SDR family oxidoreductase [Dysgonomonas sp. HGC4]MBD8349077.1 SDR family oxidoreductase [Dysgonomonas sp. HGC4]
MYNPFSLEGKTILVTGASSGIGRAIAIECSKMGARVILTARNKERLEETLLMLDNEGELYVADLSNLDDRNTLLIHLSHIDGVVHSAGITDPVPFQFITKERLDTIFDINYFSPVFLTKELLKKKILRNNSSIVFVSSIAGLLCSSVGGSAYSATKSAINGMVKGIALDLANKQIRVNTVCPGMIDTGIFDNSGITQEQLVEDSKKYPLKRYGKPEEVAHSVVYLLSEASSWVTGTNLVIDGGYTLL